VSNWTTVAESKYPWERDALDFVRQKFPPHDTYRAWSNFEFVADDGSINEVDLLVFTPQGFFLIEIKSSPGRLFGDAGAWTWQSDGRLITVDNPLIGANQKAKKLRSLLERQKACRNKGPLPFVEALVFCSAPDLACDLQGNARLRICLRDRDAAGDTPVRAGIVAAIMRRDCPGLDLYPRGKHDRPTAKVIGQALDQAGIRPLQRHRKVSDYVLEQLIGEGPGYQDWRATHSQVSESKRRVRLYLVRAGATVEDRETIRRAALREFRLMEMLAHPGVLRVHGLTEQELGPALIFEHDPLSIRLDHFLAQNSDKLSIDQRLDLVRQIAEVVRYAHEKKVVHRALCPQSILVTHLGTERPRIKIFNWQAGYRQGTASSIASAAVTATAHVDRLVEDAATAYMAPEALSDVTGEHLDIFSLGAIAYHVFSDKPPAANGLELSNTLRQTKGLSISAVLNGAGENLEFLIQFSTHPDVASRNDSAVDFLGLLDEVENELTQPDQNYVEDPTRAQINDLLPGGYRVVRRLGQGACSVALLVEHDKQFFVLKVASEPEHNDRLAAEAEILAKQEMRHPCIVDFVESLELGGRVALLLRPVFADREKRLIETLGQRLRKEGRLHLLAVVNHLEEQGVPHRDIKPDNIAVGKVGRGDKLHLVLFDFSLSRAPADNLRAGTNGYLDPLLPLRKRWDLHAERYAAAVTLYELTTGVMPKWGDGTTDPSYLSDETEITVDPELFDAGIRDQFVEFFRKAFRRDVAQRFHNAEEMLRAWRLCFEGIDEPCSLSDHPDESQLHELLADATYDTQIPELGLGTRATNALDRANVLTVEDLLTVPMRRLLRLRGVGNKTRREISAAVRTLRERLGNPAKDVGSDSDADQQPETGDLNNLSVDLLAQHLLRIRAREGETFRRAVQALLGLDSALPDRWPSQTDVSVLLGVTRARVGQILGQLEGRWFRDKALAKLRADLCEIVAAQGGVMAIEELADAILVARGSSEDEPQRTRLATAVLRAAVEAERLQAEPRLLVRRDGERILVAESAELASYAQRLGAVADRLADEDPLAAPGRVLERLQQVGPPSLIALPDARLFRLAAVASQHAALSSRQELYPRQMPAERALKLSQGALLGLRSLTIEQIRERISSRYPEATPLPGRPSLDSLLSEAGFELEWDPAGKGGVGRYINVQRDEFSVTSGSSPVPRLATASISAEIGEITPEEADARQFEERLQRGLREGSFLAIVVPPKYYERARSELCDRFPLELIDLEGLFLDALQQVAEQARVNWELVLQTDATPNNGDWDKLLLLVGRAMPLIEARMRQADKTMLVIYSGLLARYNQMDLLARLAQQVGRRDGIPGLWLLLPGDHEAVLDGKAVPLLSPAQRARVPDGWLQNVHRANGVGQT
jgi:serine/threonine protein kinase